MSGDQTVGEYRLGELEKKVDRLADKIDALPKTLDERYATKEEVADVRGDVAAITEDAATRKTATRAWMIPLVVAGVTVVLGGLGAFIIYAVQTLQYVNTLRGQ